MPLIRSLVVLDRLPYPPRAGQQLRQRQTIEALRELGPVTLLLIGRRAGAASPGLDVIATDPEVDRSPAHRLAGLLGRRGKRLVRARLRARRLRHLQHDLARRVAALAPDLVVVENVELAGYLPPLAAPGRRLVYSAHNVEHCLWAELLPLREALGESRGSARFRERIVAGEAALAARADEVWLCSATDRDLFARTYPSSLARLRVMPNAVDTRRLRPLAEARARQRPPDRAPSLLLTANFGYPPNVEAARILLEEIRPRLLPSLPNLQAVFCGRAPPAWLQAASGRNPGIIVTGEVADVRPWLAACDVAVVPLRHGGGTRIKILEALAAGCPVVSTRKGAEGLDLDDREHLRLADDADDIAAALRWCIEEPAAARAMASRGRARVEALYSWAAHAARVRAVVADAAAVAARDAVPAR